MPGLLGEGGCPETMPWEGCGAGEDAELDMPGLLGEGGRPETRVLVSDEHVLRRLLYSARPSMRRGLSGDGVGAYRLYMAHVHTHETRAWWLLSGAAPETPKSTS